MTVRELLKLVHILAAMAWFGGGAMTRLISARVAASRSRDRALAFAGDMTAGTRVLTGSKLIVLVTGVLLVTESAIWSFDQAWIITGIVIAVAASLVGFGVYSPEGHKVIAEIENGEFGRPRNIARFKLLGRLSAIELVIVVIAVWAMISKPSV